MKRSIRSYPPKADTSRAINIRVFSLQKIRWIILFFVASFPLTASSAIETIKSGSFLINMGITPQTINNGLKPYGLVYALLKNHRVPVKWVINQSKLKDSADFIHNGITYKGGVFIIPAENRTAAVNSTISSWQSLGVVGATTVSDFTANVFLTMRFIPAWTLDKDNGAIITDYFANAGIPNTAYGGSSTNAWKNPSALGSCDDIFVLPHSDPTWDLHNNLYYWNKDLKGHIWAACHGVSVLESVKNPSNTIQLNFLSTTGLLNYRDHADGSAPFTHYLPNDPVMQFMGVVDGATLHGSEQIYMPNKPGAWRSGVKLLVIDPDHSNIPSKSQGPASPLAYGRAYNDSTRGYVMYQGGHDHDKAGSATERVAAQRAFFNFSFWTTNLKAAVPVFTDSIPSGFKKGDSTPVSVNVQAPFSINNFKIKWTSSCGGSFVPTDTIRNPKFFVPANSSFDSCVISVTLTDGCNRENFGSKFAYLFTTPLSPKLNSLEARETTDATWLEWEMVHATTSDKVFIEKSQNLSNWSKLGEIAINNGNTRYQFRDPDFWNSKSWYRIKIKTSSGEIKYSNVAMVTRIQTVKTSISVIPNPGNSSSKLHIYSKYHSNSKLIISDYSGRIVLNKSVTFYPGNNQLSISELLPAAKGCFFIRLMEAEKLVSTKLWLF
jgi:hypothetical protein